MDYQEILQLDIKGNGNLMPLTQWLSQEFFTTAGPKLLAGFKLHPVYDTCKENDKTNKIDDIQILSVLLLVKVTKPLSFSYLKMSKPRSVLC